MTLSKRRSEYPVTIYPATAIGDGKKTVTTAGTAVQLTTTSTPAKMVRITANGANTGNIFVGGSTIDSTRGKQLVTLQDIQLEIDDLSKVYIDASVNGEGVTYVFTT